MLHPQKLSILYPPVLPFARKHHEQVGWIICLCTSTARLVVALIEDGIIQSKIDNQS